MRQLQNLLLILMILPLAAVAQDVRFSARADTNRILIGEQIKLQLRAELPAPQEYQWPVFPDSTEGIEIVRTSKTDTLKENGNWVLQQEIYLTSFDSGYFAIPSLIFKSGEQTIRSEAIGIAVNYPEISEEQGYYDIKKPLEVGRNWWLIILWIAIALLVIGGILLLIRYLTRRSKKQEIPPELLLDPDVYALQELDKLENEQLWQKGRYKEFHSRLIDILRVYLERQMGFAAMESTADEIIDDLRQLSLDKELNEKTKNALRLSAMVKFAKEKPLPQQNEESMSTIRSFIEKTRPEKVEKEVKHAD